MSRVYGDVVLLRTRFCDDTHQTCFESFSHDDLETLGESFPPDSPPLSGCSLGEEVAPPAGNVDTILALCLDEYDSQEDSDYDPDEEEEEEDCD